jgi:hypothetical protein
LGFRHEGVADPRERARAAMVKILPRWVTAPQRYTEVAETLAAVVLR